MITLMFFEWGIYARHWGHFLFITSFNPHNTITTLLQIRKVISEKLSHQPQVTQFLVSGRGRM